MAARRIADIVTEFRTTGLPAVRTALQAVATRVAAMRTAAQRGLGSIAQSAAPAAKALGKVSLAAAGIGAAFATLAKTSALSFVQKSVQDTVEDLKQLRQTAALTKMAPEFVSFWQRFLGQSGIAKEDVTAILGAFNTAVSEAASDPESGFAKLFAQMNVQIKDAKGNMRNLSHVFSDFALQQKKLSGQNRGFFLAQIFGDGDALKAAEAFDRIAEMGGAAVNAQFNQDLADGNLVTPQQVQIAKEYERSIVSLNETFLALKRLIFEEVGPILSRLFLNLEKVLSKNKKDIAKYFSDVLKDLIEFSLAVGIVLTGTSFEGFLAREGFEIPKWVDPAREALLVIVELTKLAARGFVAALRAADDLFARVSGKGIVDWAQSFSIDDIEMLLRKGLRWIRSFVGDVGKLFGGMWSDRDLKTGLGEWIGEALQYVSDAVAKIGGMISSEIDKVVGYVRTAWTEFTTADAAGTGVAGMTTALGAMLITVKDVADAVSKVFAEFRQVFVLGQEADAGFEWIEDLHKLLTRVMGTINSFMDIMKGALAPLQAVLDLFGGLDAAAVILAATIVGKLVAAAFGLVNIMSAGAAGTALTGALTAVGAGFGALLAPIAAFVAAAAAAAAVVAAIWDALPDVWKNGVMDTLGTSDATMGAKFLDLKNQNDASINEFGIKPGALAAWQAKNPGVSAPLGGGRYADVGMTAPDLRPVNINIAGAPAISARMSPSELDAARAMANRRTS